MKTLNAFVLGLVAAAAPTGLFAQSKTVAKIPFDFTVQTVTMPAGEYALKAAPNMPGVIEIVNLQTQSSVKVLASRVLSTRKGGEPGPGQLMFNRYGDRYFFAEVCAPQGLRGRTMPSKLEREYKANGDENQVASVAIPVGSAQ
jgi:hypothetical protein